MGLANPRVVVRYEPPARTSFRYEGEGFPFARLVNAVRLLEAEFLAVQRGGEAEFGAGCVPASVALEWDVDRSEVLNHAEGYFPPYLLVHALSMLWLDVLGRQQQAVAAQEWQRRQGAVQAATADMLPGKLIH